ncbi:TetR/AcrR family transcriptional regulator [Streptomyces sp. NPDC057743]|uniref:TetR/AcrR family transcriptional regulator n=1 Tax=Streptomyces sp. NPDC057743 TaxID=3346236 RepID=UPI0036AB3040
MDTEHIDGRSLRYQHRRPELLSAVADFVLEHGVGGLAMRPMAHAIGVSHGTLLHHFGSKENLLTEVIELLRHRLAEAADLGGSPHDLTSLTRWWRTTTAPKDMAVYRLLFEVHALAVRQPERYKRHLQRAAHDSLALMESLVLAEGCPAGQASLVASMIVAQARGLQLDLLATEDQDRVDRSFELFVDMIDRIRRSWRQENPT